MCSPNIDVGFQSCELSKNTPKQKVTLKRRAASQADRQADKQGEWGGGQVGESDTRVFGTMFQQGKGIRIVEKICLRLCDPTLS